MRKRYNIENLTSFGEMPPERHRELSARGGVASGVKRRKKSEDLEYIGKMLIQLSLLSEINEDVEEFIAWKKRKARREENRKNRERTRGTL